GRAALRGALGPGGAQADLPVRGGLHAPVRVPLLLAHEHREHSPDRALRRARPGRRPRGDIRAAGRVLRGAFRDAGALLGRLDRLPARLDLRRGALPDHRRRAAGGFGWPAVAIQPVV
ncbi:MAG: Uncharacterized MFS-type transporter, partial [uncultured Rubrobacteraceae bacterium]